MSAGVDRPSVPDDARPGRSAIGAVVATVAPDGRIRLGVGGPAAPGPLGEVDRLLTANEVAEAVGIKPDTWRSYVTRGFAPQPDDRDEGRPVNLQIHRWRTSTIAVWQASRKWSKKRIPLEAR